MQICESGVTYGPAGICIYCGDMLARLTKEHIVPFALNGDLILRHSSCDACRDITGKFEGVVLRQLLGYSRARWGLKSRGKNLPISYPITILEPDGKRWKKDVPIHELPAFYSILPTFGLPGIVLQRPAWELPGARITSIGMRHEDCEALAKYMVGGRKVTTPPLMMALEEFCRMLAKIAHSFAFAELGPTFKPLAQNLIRKGSKSPYWIVGSEDIASPSENFLFQLRLIEHSAPYGAKFLCVAIRLLSFLGTPWYIVAVADSGGYDIGRAKNGTYDKPVESR